MNDTTKWPNRYWGKLAPPSAKLEFFNAVTAPAQAGSGTVATIRMYGPIDSWGGYWGISTKDVGQVLDALPDEVTQIILRINSPGGEVFEGVSILNMLRAHKASVLAVVDGLAASAASVIAAGCDDVVMSPGTQMMIHSPSTIVWGDAAEMRKTAEVLDSVEASLIEIYSAKAGEKDWPTMLAEETWLTAAAAVEMGLADRVAVIPDAGEAETVGVDDLDDPFDDDEIEDWTSRLSGAETSLRVAARTPKLPSSSEPGDPNRKENAVAYSDLTAGLRERLGVKDAAASDETLLAALDETLAEQAETPAAPAASLPEGTVLMDAASLEELRAQAALGAQARADQVSARRDGIVTQALAEGRIAANSRDSWRAQLDKDEDGIKSLLESFPKNSTVPVAEVGHSDTLTSSEDALYAQAFGSTPKEA
jgi:ATP-dependent protease ClpP protease subunit